MPFSLKVSAQGVFPSNCTCFLSSVHILSVGQPDPQPIRFFVVVLLCSSQALRGLSKDWCGSPIAGCSDLMSDKGCGNRAFALQQDSLYLKASEIEFRRMKLLQS